MSSHKVWYVLENTYKDRSKKLLIANDCFAMMKRACTVVFYPKATNKGFVSESVLYLGLLVFKQSESLASGTDSVAGAFILLLSVVLDSNSDFGANGQHIAIVVGVRGCCVAIGYLEQSMNREQVSKGLKSYESSNKQNSDIL